MSRLNVAKRWLSWVNARPERQQSFYQAAMGVNLMAAVFFVSRLNVERYRGVPKDSSNSTIKADPVLWSQLEQSVFDSVEAQRRHDRELAEERAACAARGIPFAPPNRITRTYEFDEGRRTRTYTFVQRMPRTAGAPPPAPLVSGAIVAADPSAPSSSLATSQHMHVAATATALFQTPASTNANVRVVLSPRSSELNTNVPASSASNGSNPVASCGCAAPAPSSPTSTAA